jgi:hypothetical protein
VEDEDPVAHRQDLRQLAGDQDDAQASRREVRHDAVDLDFRTDVHAPGRLVEDQDAGLGG